jgi:sugar phosphate isomerase/epimerase
MKLGAFNAAFAANGISLPKTVEWLKGRGADTIEIGTGAYPPNQHCNLTELLGSERKQHEFMAIIRDGGLEISALSCHGNPLGGSASQRSEHDEILRDTIKLANALGIKNVNGFSGCPNDPSGGDNPNWITYPWPPEFAKML